MEVPHMGELNNKIAGNIKETFGKVTGDRSTETEGKGQKVVGDVQGAGRKVEGKVEELAGKVTGDRSEEARGDVRQQG
jgi:uncharacterized protein YjbJ (UPF0337 family)